jgi:hypothetical protein
LSNYWTLARYHSERVRFACLTVVLVACASTTAPIPDPAPEPRAPDACAKAATISVSEAHLSRSGLVLVHAVLEGLTPDVTVELPASPRMPLHDGAAAATPKVPPAFVVDSLEGAATERPQRPGFFSAIGNLLKGAVVGLANLVMLPVNLPLHLIDSKNEVFPISWNAGSLTDAYPSAEAGGPLFDDSVLALVDYQERKAAFDARAAIVKAHDDAIEARTAAAFNPRCKQENGRCELDALLGADDKHFGVQIAGPDCAARSLTAAVPAAAAPELLDESKGSAGSLRAWNETFGTRSPQLVAAASAEDAFKLAATTATETIDGATIVCSATTTRPPAKKKHAMLAARFSFGDLMVTGATVQARAGGEPIVFVVPRVSLERGGRMKVAILDTAAEWGAAAVVPFDGKLPLAFSHPRFTAECRALSAAATEELAARSLERLQQMPDLPDAAFTLDDKREEERTAARLKLVDGVRDVEALAGRAHPAAKTAQAFAEARLNAWTARLEATIAPLFARATAQIALKQGTLAPTRVRKRLQACEVKATYTPVKNGHFSLESALKELRFVDTSGKRVQPYFLTPGGMMTAKANEPIEVAFDVPMRADEATKRCAVGLDKHASPLVLQLDE